MLSCWTSLKFRRLVKSSGRKIITKIEIITVARFKLSSAIALSLVLSKCLSFGKELSFSQTSPGFYVSAVRVS